VLSAAASRLALWHSTGRRGQKLLPALIAAEIVSFSIAFGVGSGCFVHGHSADGVFGGSFRVFHGHVPFLICGVTLFHVTDHFFVLRNRALIATITVLVDINIALRAGAGRMSQL